MLQPEMEPAPGAPDVELPAGRPRTTRDLAVAKLRTALQERSGWVVVTGDSAAEAAALFADVEPRLRTLRTLCVPAAALDPEGVVRALWRDGEPPYPARFAMRTLIDEARAAKRPIVIAITDADAVDAGRLERVRLTVEGAPDASEIVRFALLGGPALVERLRAPAMRPVAMRIAASVQVPALTMSLDGAPALPAPPARGSRWGVALAVVVAAGALAWGVWRLGEPPATTPLEPGSETKVPVAAPPVGTAAAPAPPAGATDVQAAAEEEPAGAPAEAAPPSPAEAAPAAPPTPEAPPSPAEEPPVATLQPAPPVPPPAAVDAPAGRPAVARGGSVLQVGAFVRAESADALRAKLSEQFPEAYVSPTTRNGTTYHRVRVRGFRSERDVALALTWLRAAGYTPVRVRD